MHSKQGVRTGVGLSPKGTKVESCEPGDVSLAKQVALSADPLSESLHTALTHQDPSAVYEIGTSPQTRTHGDVGQVATAIVYCEGGIDGKTANGLVRHSALYKILGVIDSEKVGLDAGAVLDEEHKGIPISGNLASALIEAGGVPDYFIFGMEPTPDGSTNSAWASRFCSVARPFIAAQSTVSIPTLSPSSPK